MRLCYCGNPVFGTDKKTKIGYCKSHQYKRTDLDKRSISAKAMDKAKKEPKRKAGWFDYERIEVNDNNTMELVEVIETDRPIKSNGKTGELWRWFEKQRSLMKGICSHCGGKTQKNDDNTFHYSICHLLPKNHFKSVATNDNNWIELCYYGQSCHSNLDNHIIDLTQLNCFDEVIEKFVKMYPFIAKEERRRIPSILLEYIKNEL
ncbi:MAG: hypothetical protein ACR2HS_05890 [Gammaproteobacteria bacterium]